MEYKPNPQQDLLQVYYRNIFEQSPIAIVLCDFNGQVIQANQACLDLFEITDTEELKVYNLFNEPNLPEAAKQRIKHGESFRIELEFNLERASQAQPGMKPRTGIRYLDCQINSLRFGDGTGDQGYLIQIQDITGRKLKENQFSHQAYLLENVLDMIIAFDEQYNITYWNQAAEKGYGWKAEEVMGHNASEIFYRGLVSDEVITTRRKELIATGEFRGEVVQYTKTNTPIHIEVNSTTLKDAQGRVTGFLSVNRDITKRKQMENTLRQSEEKFKLVTMNTPDHILVQDAELRYILVVNPQLGLTEQDMIGKTDYDFLAKDDAEKLTKIKKKVLETGNPEYITAPLVSPKGETQYFAGSYIPKRNSLGQVDGIFGYFRNITEQKQIEEALRKSEEQYRALFNGMTEGFALHDIICNENGEPIDYHFLDINPAFEQLTGLTRDIIGKTHNEVLPDDNPIWIPTYGKVAITGEPVHFEDYSPALKRHFEIFAFQPAPKQFAVIFMDVSERKKQQAELVKLNRTLKALSNSSQAMIRAKDELEYLHEVCKIVVEDCGHAMVWIGYAENDVDKTVRPIASAGFEAGYLEALKISWADTERGRGPTGTAIRTGQLSKCQNMLTDPRFKPWREEALKRGYASSIVLPLMEDGKAFGAISIYSREPDPFTIAEEKLLVELANDLAYGISTIRTHKAQMVAEEALLRSEEHYRGLVELSPIAIFVNRKDRIEYLNPAALKLFNAPNQHQILGKSPYNFFHSDYHPIMHERIRLLQNGQPVPLIEEKIVRVDGVIRDVESTAISFIDSKGLAVQVMLLDITDRKIAEEKLRETRDYLEKLLNYANAPIIVWNPESKITQFNHAFEHLTGYTAVDVIGQDLDILFPKDSKEESLQKIIRTISGEFWESVEIPILRKDGSERVVLWSSANIYAPDGKTLVATIAQGQDITDRKRAEAIAVRLASFPRLNPDPIVELDQDGSIHFMNPVTARLFPNLAVLRTKHPFLAELPAIEELAKRGENDALTREVKVHESWYLQTIFLDKTEFRIRIYGHDITNRKQAEEAIARVLNETVKERKRLETVLQTIPSGVVIIEPPNGRISYVNSRAQEIYGIEHAQGVQITDYLRKVRMLRPDGSIFPLKELPATRALLNGEQVHNVEIMIKRTDGKMITIISNAAPLHDTEGNIIAAVTAFDDISNRKQIEIALQLASEELESQVQERTQDLKRANSLLERVFSSTNFLIAYLDKDFNFIRVNEAYAKIDGKKPEYFIGKNHFTVYPNAENESIFRNVIKTAKPYIAYTKPFAHTEHSKRAVAYWDWSLQPVTNIEGKIEGLVFFLVDVTKRKLAEIELHRTQQELLLAKRLADIGLLAATVAHELRNPLTVIGLAAHNVKRKVADPIVLQHAANIKKKVIEADRIIDNLLSYSKLKLPKYETITVVPFIDECLKTSKTQHEQWNIVVKKHYHCKESDVFEADPVQMVELFSNITNNAYQAFPKKKGGIDVSVTYNKTPGIVEFAIADTGAGINEKDLAKVFEPFFSRKAKGTGLGLSVCRQIVILHGGTIAMKSKLKVGTTVTISLPITRKIEKRASSS
jgi:PAS domain S-box-containing protein